jgi:hypothetical protein
MVTFQIRSRIESIISLSFPCVSGLVGMTSPSDKTVYVTVRYIMQALK